MEDMGLKINRNKTIYLMLYGNGNLDGNSDINLHGENLEKRVSTFKYIGATMAENGDLDADMTHQIESGWTNWKWVSGILCDRRISLRVKGKVYKTVIRPAMMYGAETWAVKKAQGKKLDVAEMRMLTWMSGVTKLDRIRNERIRGTKKVGEISKKAQESRSKWYGHVLSIRRQEEAKAEVVGQHQERLVGERIVRGGRARLSSMEVSHKKHRHHIKVEKDAEEEEVFFLSHTVFYSTGTLLGLIQFTSYDYVYECKQDFIMCLWGN